LHEIKTTIFEVKGDISKITYSKLHPVFKFIVEEKIVDGNENVIEKTIYNHNAKGKLIDKKKYDSENKIIEESHFKYLETDEGTVQIWTSKNSSWEFLNVIKKNFLNEYGHSKISLTYDLNENLKYKTIYEYEYY
jgi:hypothetical protein